MQHDGPTDCADHGGELLIVFGRDRDCSGPETDNRDNNIGTSQSGRTALGVMLPAATTGSLATELASSECWAPSS